MEKPSPLYPVTPVQDEVYVARFDGRTIAVGDSEETVIASARHTCQLLRPYRSGRAAVFDVVTLSRHWAPVALVAKVNQLGADDPGVPDDLVAKHLAAGAPDFAVHILQSLVCDERTPVIDIKAWKAKKPRGSQPALQHATLERIDTLIQAISQALTDWQDANELPPGTTPANTDWLGEDD